MLGGSEIEAQRVAAALRRHGHQVTVLCAGGDPMPPVSRWIDPFGTPVRLFGRSVPRRWRDHIFALGVVWSLLTMRYQVVYFLMQGLHLATGLPVAKVLGKPVLMKFSGSSIITLMRQSWLGRLELRWLRQWAKRIMILNDGMEAEALAAGFRLEQLLRMPNPVDVDEFSPGTEIERKEFRRRNHIDPEAPVVLYVGRLAPEKELPSLLGAFAQVARDMPDARLVLAGEGPDRATLEDQVRQQGIASQVRFCGRIPMDMVRAWLKASDVFALVSSNEGFSCSLVEAMATGLPSVVSDIPANTQLIDHEKHGLVAKLCDRESLALALLRLLSDASLRQAMGAAARHRVVENYSTEKVIGVYENMFAEACSPKR